MSKSGYIYLLQRVGEHEVVMSYSVRVINMRKAEKFLHDLFSDSRIDDITQEPYPRGFAILFQSQYKMGLSVSPAKRVDWINGSKLKNGKTEYFWANWLEVVFIVAWMTWLSYKIYIIPLFITGALVALWYYGFLTF